MSFISKMKFSGILLSICLLTSCVVGGQVFFSNDTALEYSTCLNQSLQTDSLGEQMSICYSEVRPDGSCDRGSYSYFGCKSLLRRYNKCTDDGKLREAYIERCMNE